MDRKLCLCCLLAFLGMADAAAQRRDSMKQVNLNEVVVSTSRKKAEVRSSSMNTEIVKSDFLNSHFSGNVVQAIENIPGVQSMDIGMGSSKPMIRGMAFNRIAVAEEGVKQEGQQWGSDHGLEIDAFSVSSVKVTKGPASLLYGSDAMGGVIEILPERMKTADQIFGEMTLIGKSVNTSLGGSLLLGMKRSTWQYQLRGTMLRYGDYRVPTDHVVYLTRELPIYNKRMKNTAGSEHDISLSAQHQKGGYESRYSLSSVSQKSGFFPGAHGIPDISRLKDDGDSWNIDLPYQWVNHIKAATHQQYQWQRTTLTADIAYQFNHREEWSEFHTHYSSQQPPETDPDKELEFKLHTVSANVFLNRQSADRMADYTVGINTQLQDNGIGGYGFLLPAYDRQTLGAFALGKWHISDDLLLTGGIRYDWGRISIKPHYDPYLTAYLEEQGYDVASLAASGSYTSALPSDGKEINRNFDDFSGSIGMVWNIDRSNMLKVNLGRSFRLPGANELSADGVHHGTFRHEQGDATLDSERGWQVDIAYNYEGRRLKAGVSPFMNIYDNYIFLSPTGEWSILPHAGQIYRYEEVKALFLGGEFSLDVSIMPWLKWHTAAEYVYTRNRDANTALAFSPPATIRNSITWQQKKFEIGAEVQTICRQEQVAHNEDITPGATLLHLNASVCIPIAGTEVHLYLQARNILDKKYYNHLSFYRKIEIPEPGRNINLSMRIPFNFKL